MTFLGVGGGGGNRHKHEENMQNSNLKIELWIKPGTLELCDDSNTCCATVPLKILDYYYSVVLLIVYYSVIYPIKEKLICK